MKIELKQKIKKITYLTVWCLLVSGLFVSLGFAVEEEGKMTCKSLKISIQQNDENFFVDEQDIRQMMFDKGDSILNQPMSSIDINNIEKLMYTNAWISKAEVYASINGQLTIELEQRKPILRIINRNDESFYLDTQGKLMLWSQKFTPRVLVASGNIFESYNGWYKFSVNDILTNDSLKKKSHLDDLYTLAKYVSTDEFWNAQVEQVVVNINNELELVPRVGNHKIIFGDITDMESKFTKLKTFYKMGLNNTGWNNYDTLNLKYKNQIVAVKKKIETEKALNRDGEKEQKEMKNKKEGFETGKNEKNKSDKEEAKEVGKKKEKKAATGKEIKKTDSVKNEKIKKKKRRSDAPPEKNKSTQKNN